MKKTSLLLMALFLVAAVSAQWGKKVKGNGKMVTIERATEDYEGVAVSGWFDVNLVAGEEGKLSIKGEENLLEYIVTEVKDGILEIRVEKGINLNPSKWEEAVLISVPVEEIESVSLSGSGDIASHTTLHAESFSTSLSGSGDISLQLEANSVSTSMSGSGDITLSGKARRFDVRISGSGDVKAYELQAEEVDATISGSADIKVTASEILKARVSGSGDIQYRGNPKKIDSKAVGSGDISRG